MSDPMSVVMQEDMMVEPVDTCGVLAYRIWRRGPSDSRGSSGRLDTDTKCL